MPWRCKVCGKVFKKSNASAEEVFRAMRRHYKRNHPSHWRVIKKKAQATRKARMEEAKGGDEFA